MAKIVKTGTYLPTQHTDETSLMQLALSKPDKVGRKLTYLYGKDSDKFPLTFMSEGQGEAGMEAVNDAQYEYDVMGKLRLNGIVANYDAISNPAPGKGLAPFYVEFEDNWLIEQYGVIAPDGVTQCRIMAPAERTSSGSFRYAFQLKTTDPLAYVDIAANLQEGMSWVMTAPTVSESHSRANRSNVQGAGKMKNQITFSRYDKEIAGNLANKVVEIEFDMEGGGTTNLWINEEMRQFEVTMRQMNEEQLWLSKYNRNASGTVSMKDWDSDKIIPESAGALEQISETNHDTYGLDLPLSKLKNTIGDIFYGEGGDSGVKEIVLYGGYGFLEDFDASIKSDVTSNLFTDALGIKTISEANGGLEYGSYFTRYKYITGDIVTVRHAAIFDEGAKATNDRINGRLHPRSGKPMSSHMGVFVDHSTYGGENNIKMYYQKNRMEISGVVKGLSPLPGAWGAVNELKGVKSMANSVDASTYTKFFSKGMNIKNTRHCFVLESI